MSVPKTGIDARGVTHWPYRYVKGGQDGVPQVDEDWSNCLIFGVPVRIASTGGAVTCLRCARYGASTVWEHEADEA